MHRRRGLYSKIDYSEREKLVHFLENGRGDREKKKKGPFIGQGGEAVSLIFISEGK